MGLALKTMGTEPFQASPEANERIESARLADVEFLVRNIVGPSLDSDDVMMLAKALTDIDQKRQSITKSAVVSTLVRFGRSRMRAEQLANAILR